MSLEEKICLVIIFVVFFVCMVYAIVLMRLIKESEKPETQVKNLLKNN